MFGKKISELVFQTYCCGCDKQVLEHEFHSQSSSPSFHSWCNYCLSQLQSHALNSCKTCGAYYRGPNPFGDTCRVCHDSRFPFRRCFSVANYRGLIQQLIIRMKRERNEILAFQLGQLLTQTIPGDVDYDLVVPIPTHWLRKLRRGFHGPSIIASAIATNHHIRFEEKGLRLCRLTEKQGKLSNSKRFQNVKNAFTANSDSKFKNQRILLIDDVMTSGATISAATRELIRAGAKTVDVGVVARGVRVS